MCGPGWQGMNVALKAKILEVLQSQYLLTLATIRPDGYPQATILIYVSDGLTLHFCDGRVFAEGRKHKAEQQGFSSHCERDRGFLQALWLVHVWCRGKDS